MTHNKDKTGKKVSRRKFLETAGIAAVAVALAKCGASFPTEGLFQKNFKTLSKTQIDKILRRLEAEYLKKYGKKFTVSSTGWDFICLCIGYITVYRLPALRLWLRRRK